MILARRPRHSLMLAREALYNRLTSYAAERGLYLPELPCPYPSYDPRFWSGSKPKDEAEGNDKTPSGN